MFWVLSERRRRRRRSLIGLLAPRQTAAWLLCAAGCSQSPQAPSAPPTPEQMAAAQQRRQNAPRPKLSLQEIGAGSYGSSLRSIRQEGSMVLLEFAPKQEGTPPQNFRRIFGTATGVIPALFASDTGIQSVRLTALDASRPDRRLVVFSVTRADSEKMDWQRNVTTERILKTVKTEYLDPEFRSLATGQKGG